MFAVHRYFCNGPDFNVLSCGTGSEIDDNDDSTTELLVADSFLILEGKAVLFPEHMDRFVNSCPDCVKKVACEFYQQHVVEVLKQFTGFPRMECRVKCRDDAGEPFFRFVIRCRIHPALRKEVSVHISTTFGDPRCVPRVKGPDFAVCDKMREEAKTKGAEEFLFLDSQGRPLEGAYSCVVWWSLLDGSLCILPEEAAVLPSVTLKALLQIAAKTNTAVKRYWLSGPEELVRHEVWVLSSLHGIRPVTKWTGMTAVKVNEERLALWRREYEQLRKFITD